MNIAGSLLPWIFGLVVIPFMARISVPLLQLACFLYSVGSLTSFLPNIALPILFFYRNIGRDEDVLRFVINSNLHPFLVSTFLLLVFTFSIWYLWNVGQMMVVFRQWKKRMRSQWTPFSKSVALLSTVVLLSIIIIAAKTRRTRTAMGGFEHRVKLSFEHLEEDRNSVLSFALSELATLDLAYNLRSRDPVHVELINSSGTGFLFKKDRSVTIYQGAGKVTNGVFSGFTLEEGEYRIDIQTVDRKGHFDLGYTLREPTLEELKHVELLKELRSGTFITDSYNEDGYVLVFHGNLTNNNEKIVYSLPSKHNSFRVSAFIVGEYEEIALIYEDDKMA